MEKTCYSSIWASCTETEGQAYTRCPNLGREAENWRNDFAASPLLERFSGWGLSEGGWDSVSSSA